MGTLFQDLRYGFRMLRKSPGFTAIAILTLALGIGANTAIFSVINSALLRPLPFKDPGQLVQLWCTESAPGNYPLTGPDYLEWQSQNRTFAATSLFSWGRDFNASGAGEPESAAVINTQANFFELLGVPPIIGRTFDAGEDQAGKNHVAVLSYGFWKRHFGGRTDVASSTIELNGEAYAVIGVMPRGFTFPSAQIKTTDIWTPLNMTPKALGTKGAHQWRAIGRLKPGVTLAQAQGDLGIIAKALAKQNPDSNDKVDAVVVSLKEELTSSSRSSLLILLGAVALVLLVACANVANLLLARASSRQREIAVRSAMGAGPWRIARQLLTESVLLSVAGAALGLLGAWWCVSAMQDAASLPIPRENPVRLDITVLLFTTGVSLTVGILFGLAPMFQALKTNLTEELKSSAQAVISPAGGRRTLRDALVIGEIAASLALLVGAGLLLRSFAQMRSAEIGVRTANVITMGIVLPQARYSSLVARREFYDRLLERIQRVPGVQAASASTEIPLEGGNNGYVTLDGNNDPSVKDQLVEWNYITPDYFRAFGIPFLQGENFSSAQIDRAAVISQKIDDLYASGKTPVVIPAEFSDVAIINRSMARAYWPNQDAVGKVFKHDDLPTRVIGVVGDTKQFGIREKTIPQAYFPLSEILIVPGLGGRLVVKTTASPTSVLNAIRSEVRGIDSGLAVFNARTMDQIVAESMEGTSVQTVLLGVFAALAMVLAAVGLYGVMAYVVTQQTHEIGIRMALGAQRNDVLRMVLKQGGKVTALGVGVGVAAALGLTSLMRSLLFGVQFTDPVTFAVVITLLTFVALAACYIPARRAMRVDPMVALRYE
jgi:putative ABC transport system permease protein